MTVKFDDILAEGLSLNEDVKAQIVEAWNARLAEAREEITAELREEFAEKFEHDKATIIQSMDRFLTEKVQDEIKEFAQDKQALVEERVKYQTRLREHTAIMEKFISDVLRREMKELRQDRSDSKANVAKLEEFLLKQLAEEVKEFHQDKKALVEERVRLLRENKQTLTEAKQAFIKKAAAVVENNINKILKTEIKQYRDDIDAARKNDFGRRIFEAFAGEYMTSYLNESGEVKKLQTQLAEVNQKLEEAVSQVQEKQRLVEDSERKLAAAADRRNRDKVMSGLLKPLSKQQQSVMEELLKTVKTSKLEESFKKYLPAVLNETPQKTDTKENLTESVRTEKTGDRRPNVSEVENDADFALEMNQLRKLAGINNTKN